MKHNPAEYLRFDPFEGDMDVDIRCQTVKLVTVRKRHECWMGPACFPERPHFIEPGQQARFEQAIVDGEWGRYYVCIPCMDEWLDEVIGTNEQDLEMPHGRE